ncbi:MAG: hypothetical protein ACFHHU_00615 [Porticoccaceae bacterium]
MKTSTQAVSFDLPSLGRASSVLSGVGMGLYQDIQMSIKEQKRMPTIDQLAERYEKDAGKLRKQVEEQLGKLKNDLGYLSDFTVTADGDIQVSVAEGFSLKQVDTKAKSIN